MISDWRNYESWREAGGPTAYDTANRLYKEKLAILCPAPDGSKPFARSSKPSSRGARPKAA